MNPNTAHRLQEGLDWLDKYDRGQVEDGPVVPPTDVTFLDVQEVLALHEAALGKGKGALAKRETLRDPAALESALARARNAMAYGQASVEQAAWLMAEGIVKNHPFTNGNKRTALMALVVFWEKNGVPVPHDGVWLARRILALAER